MKRMNVQSLSERQIKKLMRKSAFSQYVNLHIKPIRELESRGFIEASCCGKNFEQLKDLHRHISIVHSEEIEKMYLEIQQNFYDNQLKEDFITPPSNLCSKTKFIGNFCDLETYKCACEGVEFIVLLFYYYVDIATTSLAEMQHWQISICRKLCLKGKIRLAMEGINGTVEGCNCATEKYKKLVLDNDYFSCMSRDDFKSSIGSGKSFDELSVTICPELCTLGIPSKDLLASEGGTYLTPDEFHKHLEEINCQNEAGGKQDLPIIVDCRNFYETKIGNFCGSIKPDLRKFSYFPEYVDRNKDLFSGRKVLTYCTGGIRCERATAYLKKATKCCEVYQLKGGIHKYLEKYPDGYFKGKLFVFDNRYSIGPDDSEVISTCFFCETPHDDYKLCSTDGCRQLVLICPSCRNFGISTCCEVCKRNAQENLTIKQCTCTENRDRAPREVLTIVQAASNDPVKKE